MSDRPAERPTEFIVQYNGRPIRFWWINAGEETKGYAFYCPKHNPAKAAARGAHNWIDTESGKRHTLTFDAQGRATIRASILCRTPMKGKVGTPIPGADNRVECGWHVFVTDGVARDV